MQKRIAVSVLLLLGLCACGAQGNYVRDSYRALTAMGTTYQVTMAGLKELREQGALAEQDRLKALRYGRMFHDAYHPAVEGLRLIKAGRDPGADVGALVVEASRGFGQLMAVAGEYLQEE